MTDEITFNNEPDLPPAIFDAPGAKHRIGRHIWFDKSPPPGPTPMPAQLELNVVIRDENVTQVLVAHWRVVHADNPMPRFDSVEIGPTTDSPERDFQFFVDTQDLRDDDCHRLELAVSGSFFNNQNQPIYFDRVRDGRDHDLARASWWILEGREDEPSEAVKAGLLNSCAELERVEAAQQQAVQESAP